MAGRRKARPIDDPMEGSSKHFINKKSKPQPKEKSKQSKINFFLQPTSSPVPKPIPKAVSEPQKPKPQPVSHHPNRINTFAAEYFLQNSNTEVILTKMFNDYNMYETKKHRMVAYANEWLHTYIERPHLKVLDKLTFKSAHTESCVWLLARNPELSSDNKFKQYLQLTNNRHCYVNMRKKNNLLRIEQSIMERDVERHGRKGLNKVQSLSKRALKRYNGQFKRDDPVVPLKTDEKVVDVQQVEPEDRSHEQSAIEGIVDVQPAINEQTSVDQNAEQVLINEELDRLKKLSLAEFEQKSNVHKLYALLESDSDEETCTLSQFVMISYKALLLDQPHFLRYEEPEVIDLDPPNETKQIIENHTKNTTDIIELDSSDAEASLAEENVPEQTTDMANAQVITPKPILTITEFLNKSSFFSKTMGLFASNYMAMESFKCFLNGEFIGLTMADKFSLENYDLERSKMVPEEAMLAELTKILEQTSPTDESVKRPNPEPDIENVVNKKARMEKSPLAPPVERRRAENRIHNITMAGRRKARPIDDPMEGSSKHFINKKSKPQPKEKSKQSKINFFLQPTSSPVPKPIPKAVSEPQKPKPQPVSHHPNRINTFAAEYFLQNSNTEVILTKMFNDYNMYETKKHRMVAYANEWLHKYIERPHLKVFDKLTFKSAHTESCVWLLARNPELSSDNKFKQYLQLTNNRHCYVNMRKKNNLLRIEQSIMERDVERHGRKGLNKVQSLSKRALKRYNGQFKRDDPVVPLKTDEKVVDVQQVEPEDRSHEQSAIEGIVDVQPAINEQTSVDQNAEQVLINEELDRLKKLSLAEFEQKSNVHKLYALLESDSDEETCTLSQFVMISYKALLLDQPHFLRYEEPEVIDLDPPNETKQIIENHTKNTTDIIELDSSDAEASLAEENVPEQTTDMANAQVITPKPILTITEFLNKSSFFSKTMGLFASNYMAMESFKCFLNGEFIGLTMADKFSLENYDLERSKMVPEEAMLAELTKILEQTSPTDESVKRPNPEPDIENVVNKKARMEKSPLAPPVERRRAENRIHNITMAGRRKARPIDDPMEGSSKHFINKKSKPQPKEKSKQSKINFFLQPTSSPVPKPIPKAVSEPQKPKPQPVSHHPNRINTFAAEYFLQNSNTEVILTKMFNDYNMYETKKHRMVAYANEWLHTYIERPHLKVLDKLTFKSAHTESCVWLLARNPELSSDNKFKQYLQLTNNRHCYVNMRKKNNLLRIEQSIMERDVERHGRKGLNKVQSLSKRALKRYNGQFKRDDPVVPLKTDEKVVDVQQVEPEDRSHEQSAIEGIVDVQPAINEQTSVDQNAEQVLINEELDRLKKLSLAEFEQKSNVHKLYALLESDSDEETCTLSQFVMISYKALLLDQPHFLRYEEPEVIDLDPPNETKQIIENHTKNTTDIIELDSSDAEASLAEENVPEQTTDMANAQVITPKPILTITEFLNKSSFFSKTMGLFASNYMAMESFKCFLNGEFIGLTMADKFSLENYDLERSKMVPEEAMLAELTKILEQTSPTDESVKRPNPEPDIENVVNKKARMEKSPLAPPVERRRAENRIHNITMAGRRKARPIDDPMEGSSKHFINKKSKPQPKEKSKQSKINFFLQPTSSPVPKPIPKAVSEPQKPKPQPVSHHPNRINTFAAEYFLQNSNTEVILTKMFNDYNMYETKKHRMVAYANEWLHKYIERPHLKVFDKLTFKSAHTESCVWLLARNPELSSDNKFKQYLQLTNNRHCYVNMRKKNNLLRIEQSIMERDVERHGRKGLNKVQSLSKRALKRYNGQFKRDDPVVPLKTDEKVVDVQQVEPEDRSHEQSAIEGIVDVQPAINEQTSVDQNAEQVLINEELDRLKKLSLAEFEQKSNVHKLYALLESDSDEETCTLSQFVMISYKALLLDQPHFLRYEEPEVIDLDPPNETKQIIENHTKNTTDIIELDSSDAEASLAEENVPEQTTDMANAQVITPKPILTITEFLNKSSFFSKTMGLFASNYMAMESFKCFLNGEFIGLTMADKFSLENYDLERSKMVPEEAMLAELTKILEQTSPTDESVKRPNPEPDIENVVNKKARMEKSPLAPPVERRRAENRSSSKHFINKKSKPQPKEKSKQSKINFFLQPTSSPVPKPIPKAVSEPQKPKPQPVSHHPNRINNRHCYVNMRKNNDLLRIEQSIMERDVERHGRKGPNKVQSLSKRALKRYNGQFKRDDPVVPLKTDEKVVDVQQVEPGTIKWKLNVGDNRHK